MWLIVLVGVLAVALLGSVAFATWSVIRWSDPARTPTEAGIPQYAQQAVTAATAASERIFSYDYRTFDNDVKRGLEVCTGGFADDYRELTEALRAHAEREQAIVRAEVSEASVVKASPKRVEVLLFLNQYRRNVNLTGEKVDQNRTVLVMVPGPKHTWLISEATAL
ncbi:MAG: hypothetical protein ACRDT4_21580 [Micromonosporaceae bacterium]